MSASLFDNAVAKNILELAASTAATATDGPESASLSASKGRGEDSSSFSTAESGADFRDVRNFRSAWFDPPNLCRSRLFPDPAICELCYDDSGNFRSRKTVLRYLYSVYTREKII